MRSAARSIPLAAPLALVRDDAPPLTASAPAHRWRRLVGRRRGVDVAVALLYAGGIAAVVMLADAAGDQLAGMRQP